MLFVQSKKTNSELVSFSPSCRPQGCDSSQTQREGRLQNTLLLANADSSQLLVYNRELSLLTDVSRHILLK